jgi:hypothetical protein
MAAEDLTRSAHAAVLAARLFRERVGDAREGADEAAERIVALNDTLEADRKALHEAAQELAHDVEEAGKRLSEDVAAAETGFGEVAQLASDAGAEAHQALDTEAAGLDGVATHLREIAPQIASLAESAAAASQAAVERAEAIARELGALVEEVERLLTEDLAPALENMAQEIEEMVEPVQKVLDVYGPEKLLAKEEEFIARTSDAEDVVNATFAKLEEHADQVAEYAVTQAGTLVEKEMDALEAETRTLEGDLENLTGLAAEKRAALEQSGQSMASTMASNGEAAQTVEQALVEIRGRWVTFGFAD